VGNSENSKSLSQAWQKLYVYRSLEQQGLPEKTIAKIAGLPDSPAAPEAIVGNIENSKSLPEASQKLNVYRSLEQQGLPEKTIAKITSLPDSPATAGPNGTQQRSVSGIVQDINTPSSKQIVDPNLKLPTNKQPPVLSPIPLPQIPLFLSEKPEAPWWYTAPTAPTKDNKFIFGPETT
jgi:hypothetical protein